MTIQQLEVFAKIVETGSFTKAGEALMFTQSAISHIISGLEEELGFPLLYRNRNGICITEEGKVILQHSLELLNKAELIRQHAASMLGLEYGILKVGCFQSFGTTFLPNLLGNFQEKYPGITLNIFEGGYSEIETAIATGMIDLGFSVSPEEGFDTIPLLEDKYIMIVYDSHPFSKRSEVSLQEINSEYFIMPKSGCEVFLRKAFKDHHVAPNILFNIKDNNTLISMVNSGLGISILPEIALQYRPEHIKVVNIVPALSREICLIAKSLKTASPASSVFINEVKSYFNL